MCMCVRHTIKVLSIAVTRNIQPRSSRRVKVKVKVRLRVRVMCK